MPTTVRNDGILFNDSSVQTSAASSSKIYNTRILISGTTYTPSISVNRFWAFVFGASTFGHTVSVGAPGGTGYSEKLYSSPSGSYSYTIGARGYQTTAGSTTFDTITVTGAAYATTTSGTAGGAGSGGDFNATGGTGGSTSTSAYAGIGGPGTRAGNGGNGADSVSDTGGGAGGTGGNNASGATGGAAATSVSGSALTLPWSPIEYFSAGGSGSSNNPGGRAPGGLFWNTTNIGITIFKDTGVNNSFTSTNLPSYGNGSFNDSYIGPVYAHSVNTYANIATGPISNIGGNGFIIIIEELK
jgi:hypothetical protein